MLRVCHRTPCCPPSECGSRHVRESWDKAWTERDADADSDSDSDERSVAHASWPTFAVTTYDCADFCPVLGYPLPLSIPLQASLCGKFNAFCAGHCSMKCGHALGWHGSATRWAEHSLLYHHIPWEVKRVFNWFDNQMKDLAWKRIPNDTIWSPSPSYKRGIPIMQ